MAVVFAESFDGYTGAAPASPTAASLTSRYALTSTGFTLVAGRFGGQALRMPNGFTVNALLISPFTAVSSFTLCLSVRFISAGAVAPAIALLSDTTTMIGVTFNTSGGIAIERGNVQIAASANSLLPTNVWHTLKISVVIDDTAGSVVINLNGEQVLNATGLDTRNGTPTTINKIQFNPESASLAEAYYDDLFITDSATAPTEDYFIEAVPVNADGTPLDWTPSTGTDHFETINELPCVTTDYNSASTVGNIDEIEVGAMASTPSSILAAQFVGHFDKTDGAARGVKLGVKSGATTSAGTEVFLTAGGVRVDRLLNTDPNTAAAWTKVNLEATKIRPEVST